MFPDAKGNIGSAGGQSGLSVVCGRAWIKAHRLAVRVDALDRERNRTPDVFKNGLRRLWKRRRDHFD
jgi:hypothetical protein